MKLPKILAKGNIDLGHFKIKECTIKVKTEDFTERYIYRYVSPKTSVAVFVFNTDTKEAIFVKQCRIPIYDSYQIPDVCEVVAGGIDEDEGKRDAAIREVEEEIGYRIRHTNLHFHRMVFLTPGLSDEACYLFIAYVSDNDKFDNSSLKPGEYEDIEIITVPISELDQLLLGDAKSIILTEEFLKMNGDYYD